ncbi:MAG: hypothetical protein NDI90_03555 [Nitrospira sp. BO4]|nr:hypothetical protein [Nitrospira sp. BO4]
MDEMKPIFGSGKKSPYLGCSEWVDMSACRLASLHNHPNLGNWIRAYRAIVNGMVVQLSERGQDVEDRPLCQSLIV